MHKLAAENVREDETFLYRSFTDSVVSRRSVLMPFVEKEENS
jgi:hypothetical protein